MRMKDKGYTTMAYEDPSLNFYPCDLAEILIASNEVSNELTPICIQQFGGFAEEEFIYNLFNCPDKAIDQLRSAMISHCEDDLVLVTQNERAYLRLETEC